MSFQDKSIQCSDCGTNFTFSAGEQDFFQSKGFTNEPRRCPSCRRAKKAQRSNSNYSYSPKWWMLCAECDKDNELPLEPRGDKTGYLRIATIKFD